MQSVPSRAARANRNPLPAPHRLASAPAEAPRPASPRRHAADLLRLAAPLAVAQIAQMAMGVTDTVLLGALGAPALAAGGLGASLFFTTSILLQGVLASVAILASQARGAGRADRVPEIYRTGLLLATLLAIPAFAWLSSAEAVLLALGEPPALAHDVGRYLRVLRWGAPGALVGVGLMRAFLTAIDASRMLLLVVPVAVLVNGVLNYGLIHGAWGLPRLGLLGSAAATASTLWGMALALLTLLHTRRRLRPFVRPRRPGTDHPGTDHPGSGRPGLCHPGLRRLAEMLRLGIPIGATNGVEVFLFLATFVMMGWVGPAAMAAHQITINVASACFMVPLALSQATNVRVGFWTGAGRRDEARRAGLVALALAAGFMCATGLVLGLLPRRIIGLYIDVAAPENADIVAVALGLMAAAGLFQVADGVQVVASGALRGLRDTSVPLALATLGYWGIGFPSGYLLAFHAGLGALGLWLGLAGGLGAAALMLTLRFHLRTRTPAGAADPA